MKWLLFLPLLPLVLIGGALLANRAPLWEPPGPLPRLQLYLTTHTAETRHGHQRPELHPLRLPLAEDQAREAVLDAMEHLGWRERRVGEGVIRAVAVSSLFRFRDDVEVRLEPAAEGVFVQVRSASRIGQGDLAANTRHVLDLFRRLARIRHQDAEFRGQPAKQIGRSSAKESP